MSNYLGISRYYPFAYSLRKGTWKPFILICKIILANRDTRTLFASLHDGAGGTCFLICQIILVVYDG